MRVTVLMATFNRSQIVNGISLLERSIISFLNQDYENSTLLILDDCSTDNTKDILKRYEGHPRIEIIYGTENRMPPNNWNYLWSLSTSDLICQLHDDDELMREGISMRVQRFIDDPELDVVYGGVVTQNLSVTQAQVIYAQEPSLERIVRDEYINFTTLMYRRTLPFRFDADLRYYFDWLFKIRCLKECKVGFVPNAVMRYTTHQGQESNRCRRENMNEIEERQMRLKLSDLYKWF